MMKEPGKTNIQMMNQANKVMKMMNITKDPVFVTSLEINQNTSNKLKATPPMIEYKTFPI